MTFNLVYFFNRQMNSLTVAGGHFIPDIPDILDVDFIGSWIAVIAGGLFAGIMFWKKFPRSRPLMQLASLWAEREGLNYPVIVDMLDSSGGWLRQLFWGLIHGYYVPVLIRFRGVVFYGLMESPDGINPMHLDRQVVIDRRNMGPTTDTVWTRYTLSPNRDHWEYLERTHNLRVMTGYGSSAIVLTANELHPDLEDDDDWDLIGIDATGCFIVHDAHFEGNI